MKERERRHSIEKEIEIKESEFYKTVRPPPLFYGKLPESYFKTQLLSTTESINRDILFVLEIGNEFSILFFSTYPPS